MPTKEDTCGSPGETGVSIEQLITEHLDIWTAADTEKKSGRGRSSGTTGNVYGVKKLRELILELAVRGKLVPQDASDEPASELLKRIAAEKAKLLAEGKIKKSKPLAEITDDEKPFELPVGWEWVRLGNICSYIQRGKGPSYVDNSEFIVVSQKCVRWSGLDLSQARFIEPESITKYESVRFLSEGDILWNSTGTGTIGRACIVPTQTSQQVMVADSHVTVVRPIGFGSLFLWRWIQSPSVQSKIEGVASGSTNQIELNTSTVITQVLPLPPLAEQHRIVAKVDELMALCDQLENQHNNAAEAHEKLVTHLLGTLTQSQNAEDFNTNWHRISEHFDTLFTTEASIDALKQTLLQLAVMGKLVPQDPNDEPASELLKRIQAEKAKLITEGKIKKDKPLAEISEEEKPFDLPQNWSWVRLGTITEIRGGKRVSNGYQLLMEPTPYIYIRVSDMKNGTIDDSDLRYIDTEMQEKISRYIITKDDIYMTIVGATIGKCGIIPEKFDQMNLTENAARITPWEGSEKQFLYKCLDSLLCQNQFFDKTKQVGVQKMALNRLASTIIPLPPTTEQRRIINKIDELMALCDQVKFRITSANQLQQKLAYVMVEQATA